MVSLTKADLEYINNFYVKDGEIKVIDIDKTERLCIVSVPIIDSQEDETEQKKIITIPIDYIYDGEDVEIYHVPDMMDDDDIHTIIESIWESYKTTFAVKITETLEKVVYVEANNKAEAEEIAEENWNNSEYILDAENFVCARFEAKGNNQ